MLTACLLFLWGATTAYAQTPTPRPNATRTTPTPRKVTRLFIQDEQARQLKWTDLQDGETPQFGKFQQVSGFPQLDPERQSLVQMEVSHGLLLVGVRDAEGGSFQSGWVLIDTGVEEEDHGDHSHWYYVREPRVRALELNDQQGNPAHLYQYQGVFYLANDQKDGYTRLDPAAIQPDHTEEQIRQLAAFHAGGGGHITLAVSDAGYGYSTWIDRAGENSGRVDVTAIRPTGNMEIASTFFLPHGGLHGATYCEGKIFLAPADGIYWVPATGPVSAEFPQTEIRHVSLGSFNDKPRRAGSFTTLGRMVLFTSGGGTDAALYLLDASAPEPKPWRVDLPMHEENRPAGLEVVRPRKGGPLAFVFHDHAADADAPNLLTVIELDPNGDGSFADAKVSDSLEVGPSLVEGHSGHHSITFEPTGRWGVLTNPGDGTAVLLSLADRKIVSKVQLGGVPAKVIAVGGGGRAGARQSQAR